jgi:teichuronic acid biosynthesis glycosyltransferase TuaG
MNFNFVFIIPSYNNQDWYKYNIKSINKQSYNNWRAIYIDDNSTDNTLELVKKYNQDFEKFGYDPK